MQFFLVLAEQLNSVQQAFWLCLHNDITYIECTRISSKKILLRHLDIIHTIITLPCQREILRKCEDVKESSYFPNEYSYICVRNFNREGSMSRVSPNLFIIAEINKIEYFQMYPLSLKSIRPIPVLPRLLERS